MADRANFVQLTGFSKQAVTATFEVMDSHLFKSNKQNTMALPAILRSSDLRSKSIELKFWETADRYLADFKARLGANWAKRS